MTVDADSALNISITTDQSGSATLVVRATDSGALFVEDTFVVTVSPVNDAPTVVSAIPDTTANEDNVSLAYRDLNDVFDELEDDGALTFTIESNSNPGLITATTGTVGVTFQSVSTAQVDTNVQAIDVDKPTGTAAGDLLIASFTSDGNRTLSPPDGSWVLIEGGGGNPVDMTPSFGVWYKIAGAFEPSVYTFSGGSSSQLYIAVLRYDGHDPVSPINASAIANSTGSSTPSAPDVTATVDGCKILRLFGADDDDTPYTVPGGYTERYSGVSSTLPSSCGSAGADADQALAGATGTAAFSMSAPEEWQAVTIAIAPASVGSLYLGFAPDASGTATILVRATDPGALFVEDVFDVVVTAENDTPVVVVAIPDTTVAEDSGDILNYRDLNDVFSDVEDGTALSYTAVSTNPTLISPVVDMADSTLDLTLGANEVGTATITVRATDSGVLFVEDVFAVVVTGANDPPVVVSAITDTTVVEDSGDIANYRDLNDVFSDVEDGRALSYTAVSTNPTLISPVVDGADSTLDLTLAANQNGTAQVTVRATDSGGLWVEDVFDVVVTADNDAPLVAVAIPDTSVAEDSGDILNYRDLNDVFGDVEDGTALAFTVESNSNLRTVRWISPWPRTRVGRLRSPFVRRIVEGFGWRMCSMWW